MKGIRITAALTGLAACLSVPAVSAQTAMQPYVLAYTSSADVQAEAGKVKDKLSGAGFEVVGEYSPYAGTDVICITSDALKQAAAQTKLGGFAAVERVALSQSGGSTQVSYLNPPYMAAAYQLNTDLAPVAASLKSALGAQAEFGTEKGRTAEQLRDYHYMIGMEYFKDVYRLASYKSHDAAVAAVKANLQKGVGGTALVYEVAVPGKQQTVFGVSRAKVGDSAANDKHIMADTVETNFKDKTAAYLPYDMMVNGNDVIALNMRFRMAVWHPDLTMITFGKLMSSPGAIGDLLTKVAGGQTEESSDF